MNTLNLKLKIWRQNDANTPGSLVDYQLDNVSTDSSFLEMLDTLNEQLISKNEEPISFDHDCREGICGMCSLMINGRPHGPQKATTTCQLHMRSFKNNDTVIIEPFRAKAFPVIKDLMVDRSSFDHIMSSGGYVSVSTGQPQDANQILIPKETADTAMDAAACIGCGACVASCKNASASLFVAAKVSQLALLPQGQKESKSRVLNMVDKMDELGFGHCTNETECEAVCPKEISVSHIARLNREFAWAKLNNKN